MLSNHAVIAQKGPLARSAAPRGLVVPRKLRDEVQGALLSDPAGAGQIGPIAALLVELDGKHRLSPRVLHCARFGSVTTRLDSTGKV